MRGGIPPLHQYAFIAWCSVKSIGSPLALPFVVYLMVVTKHFNVLGSANLKLFLFNFAIQNVHVSFRHTKSSKKYKDRGKVVPVLFN
jgi:hypothetical protein